VSDALLRVTDLRTGYGSMPVLHGLSFEVVRGEMAVVLGTNGVGKTTTLRTIAGLLPKWSGSIEFEGALIEKKTPEQLVARGIGVVPGPPGVFRDLSVLDNLRVGSFALGRDRRRAEQRLARALEAFPILAERRDQAAGSLSGGEQRMLAVARALMGEPRLLLVDEASIGLSPAMVRSTFALLDQVRADGVTVLMVEQNVAALDVATHAFVMERGRVVREAHGDEVAGMRDELARAYLGGGEAEPVLAGRMRR